MVLEQMNQSTAESIVKQLKRIADSLEASNKLEVEKQKRLF